MIAFFIGRFFFQIVIHLHGRAETAALVDVEGHQALVPRLHLSGLLTEGQEKIFRQAPVKKCADFSGLCYFQKGNLAQLDSRLLSGGDETVL